jgi:hypothetical protein
MNQISNSSITLFFRSCPSRDYQVNSLVTSEKTLIIQPQPVNPNSGLYLELIHEQLNTQLDLGRIAPAVILQFDEGFLFTGASLSLGNHSGGFGLVTQSKRLVILPFDDQFPIDQLTHFQVTRE